MELIQISISLGYPKHSGFPSKELDEQPITSLYKSIEYFLIQRWILAKYNLYVEVTTEAFMDGFNYNVQVKDLELGKRKVKEEYKLFGDRSTGLYGDEHEFPTSIEALEFGLQKAIEIIINSEKTK
jgi:hypothetical protein